ncbi:MAG: DUF6586 family protein [Halioglobus sp.]
MSSPRGRANHALYLARLQLAAWNVELAREVVPAARLDEAFAPAACAHLKQAYGWFLLTLAGHSDTTVTPPECCSELPDVAVGKAVPAEITEFAQLEQDGWLADLLSVQFTTQTRQRPLAGRMTNLAVGASDTPSADAVTAYADQLDEHMARMSNSLDEY